MATTALGGVARGVCGLLNGSKVRGWCQIPQVDIDHACSFKRRLESAAIEKRVSAPADAAALSDVDERVYLSVVKGGKEPTLIESISADRNEFHGYGCG